MEDATRIKLIKGVIVIVIFLAVNIIGAAILLPLEPQLDYLNAFYLMMSTSTTVGYGNVAPETGGGKMFLSFYQIIPISLFFYLFSLIF